VCALAHWIERAGIPTTLIALVREHAEAMRPPRALWVPFELGRPLGPPGQPAFQQRVLRAAFDLLADTAGPVLRDFTEEAPAATAEEIAGWVCPIPLRGSVPDAAASGRSATDRLLAEIDRLRPWYEIGRQKRGRSAVGASRLPVRDAARLVGAFLDGAGSAAPPSPVPGVADAVALKLACDDLVAYAMEAATAEQGTANAAALGDWFWNTTETGQLLHKVRAKALAQTGDALLQRVGGRNIVPASRVRPD